MTTRELCASGNHELLKGGVHASACAIAAAMAAYNIAAWTYRRDRHLWINGLVYTLACAWEVKQTLHHMAACEAAPPSSSAEKPAA